jgi:hypothetical protein
MQFTSAQQILDFHRETRSFIIVNKIFIDAAGDLVTGAILNQIVFWSVPNHNGKSKLTVSHDGHLWLAKRRADWSDELRISPKQADRAIGKLVADGIIVKKIYRYNGSPTQHVRLHMDGLLAAVNAVSGAASASQESGALLLDGEAGSGPKGDLQMPQRGISLTDTTTENTTERKTGESDADAPPPLSSDLRCGTKNVTVPIDNSIHHGHVTLGSRREVGHRSTSGAARPRRTTVELKTPVADMTFDEYRDWLGMESVKGKPVANWTGRDFVVHFYVGIAKYGGGLKTEPSWRKDAQLMKRHLKNYGNERLKGLIIFLCKNREKLESAIGRPIELSMSTLSTDWLMKKVVKYASQPSRMEKGPTAEATGAVTAENFGAKLSGGAIRRLR